MYKINETKPTEEGTVFETTINNTKIKALFDTGATKSVMSGKMYRNLKLGPLDDSNLPSVVGAKWLKFRSNGTHKMYNRLSRKMKINLIKHS